MADRKDMVQISVEELAKGTDDARLTDSIRTKRILPMLAGRHFAVIANVERFGANHDAEDFDYITDPEFWRMIQERRKEIRTPLEQIEAELGIARKRSKAEAAHKGT